MSFGGTDWISMFVDKDMRIWYTNGNTMSTPPSSSRMCTPTKRRCDTVSPRLARAATSTAESSGPVLTSDIVHPSLLPQELDEGHDGNEGKDNDRHGSTEPLVMVDEGLAVEQRHQRASPRLSRVPRSDHRVQRVKQLEPTDRRHDRQEEDRRGQQRHRDHPELSPGRGTVNGRGLVQLPRDRLQPRRQDDHVEPDRRPQPKQGNSEQRPSR